MDPQQMMAYSLLGLLICNILTLVAIAVAGMQVFRAVNGIKEQTQNALHNVQKQVSDTLKHITPVIDNIQASTRALRSSAESAQDTVRGVESQVATVAGPVSALMVAGRVLHWRGAKLGALGLIAGAILNARRRSPSHRGGAWSAFLPLPRTSGRRP